MPSLPITIVLPDAVTLATDAQVDALMPSGTLVIVSFAQLLPVQYTSDAVKVKAVPETVTSISALLELALHDINGKVLSVATEYPVSHAKLHDSPYDSPVIVREVDVVALNVPMLEHCVDGTTFEGMLLKTNWLHAFGVQLCCQQFGPQLSQVRVKT